MSESPGRDRRRISLERSYAPGLETVWDLWSSKAGIETWWGPDGFSVTARDLDLSVSGRLVYTMAATTPEQVEFMTRAGMPIAVDTTIVYTEIEPMRRLGFMTMADFIPGVEPYEVGTSLLFHPEPAGVRMVLTFDAMHDEEWTERAVMGRAGERRRLGVLVGAD